MSTLGYKWEGKNSKCSNSIFYSTGPKQTAPNGYLGTIISGNKENRLLDSST